MAASLARHEGTCPSLSRGDSTSGARRPGIGSLPGSGPVYKKGKNGLKRGESEVSPTPSETPSKKRIRYSPSRSVGSVDTSYPLASTAASINGIDPASTGAGGGGSQSNHAATAGGGKEKDKTVGMIDSDDGRMWLENGRKETKKQMSKRLAEERRVQKREEMAERERIKAGVSTGQVTLTVPDLKIKKPSGGPKPIKEYEPDKHCGVPNDLGNPCVRKLDCKIHTVGDKRNVPGRTMSYDDCLRVYKGEPPRGPGDPSTGGGGATQGGGETKAGAAKKARRRGPGSGGDDASRRKFGFLGLTPSVGASGGDGSAAEQEEDWEAHPLAAMHEFAELLDCVRRENVLLEGLVRRRACDELRGRVMGGGGGGETDQQGRGKKPVVPPAMADGETVPPPRQPDSQVKLNSTTAAAGADKSVPTTTGQESTFGGFDFLDVPPPAAVAVPPSTKPAAGVPAQSSSSGEPGAKPTTTGGKHTATVPPSQMGATYGPNILARETFAGGATTGSWHLDRRRMVGAEKCFGDILAQLNG
ncbi:hypothetical protein QFC19_009343 [Naganishia cerealis]|uniref:Uncharacterized protein n=1 Tax=Naganishia cerealis TaxID=610337 RepID=A0ACC2UX26_9TREE|nr:hypothetical protein QFC19_009343 [Naganishia cerealis]